LKTSVVIATKGRPESLIAAVHSIGIQTIAADEIVIIDQTPKPLEIRLLNEVLCEVLSPPRLVYYWDSAIGGLTQARNIGVRKSVGDIIIFIDDDVVLGSDFLASLLPLFDDTYVAGATGNMIDPEASKRWLRNIFFRYFYVGPFHEDRNEFSLRPPSAPCFTNSLPGCVSAYRRAVFDAYQFDENLTGPAIGEDLDFSYRVGRKWRLAIEPHAVFYHYRAPAEWRQTRRVFAGKVVFYHYHFRKNMRGNALEWLAFIWLNCGFFFDSLLRFSIEPVLGIADGWRQITTHGLCVRPPK
jgi:GT2 family glycosyltransferase